MNYESPMIDAVEPTVKSRAETSADNGVVSRAVAGKALRVLLVSASSGSQGGGELYFVGLSEQLQADGHQVEVLLSDHLRTTELANRLSQYARIHRVPYVNTYDRKLRTLGAAFDRRTANRIAAL